MRSRGPLSQLTCMLAAVVAGAPAGASPGARPPAFEPCTLAAADMPDTVAAQCTDIDVTLDRSRAGGGTLRLAIARVPSTARKPRPDPVFLIAGGPGQSAKQAYPGVAIAFQHVLRERDVILVDQRGTGGSHALDCGTDVAAGPDATGRGATDVDAWRRAAKACLDRLDVDPRAFTTTDAVADLDDVRAALGADRINLVGVSYGTRVALEYARRHPDRTRTLVLDGVVPPTLALGADHGRNLDEALAKVFAACAQDPVCAERRPGPRDTLDGLLARLRERPVEVTFRDPVTDAVRTETLTAQRVAAVVRLYAYAPALAALLPYTLAEAAAGRPERLTAQSAMIEDLVGEQINVGLQLAVTCTEDAPLLERGDMVHPPMLGEDFVAALLAQCSVWPRGRMPADFHAPLRSPVPALLLSGELDPVTPPRYGEEVAATLPNARHVVATGQGHNVMVVGCIPRLMGDFLRTANAKELDASCAGRIAETPPFGGAYGWEP